MATKRYLKNTQTESGTTGTPSSLGAICDLSVTQGSSTSLASGTLGGSVNYDTVPAKSFTMTVGAGVIADGTNDYNYSWQVTASDDELNAKPRLRRVDSSGVTQATSGFGTEVTSGGGDIIGIHTGTISFNAGTWAAGDRIVLDLHAYDNGPGSQTFTLAVNDADSWVETPEGGTSVITPSPLTVQATIVAPVITVGVTLSPTPLSVRATVVAPVISWGNTVSLAPVSVAAAIVAPNVTVAVPVSLDPIAVEATVIAPTITANVVTTPAPLSVAATIVAPLVTWGNAVTLSPVAATATIVAPVVSMGTTIEPDPIDVEATVIAPTITANVVATPAPLSVGATIVAPLVTWGNAVVLSPLQVRASLVALTVAGGVEENPSEDEDNDDPFAGIIMARVGDRIREISYSTGTGEFTLSGTVEGFHTFAESPQFDASSGGTENDEVYYCIVTANESLDAWEIGKGTLVFGTATTLQRDIVYNSSGVEATCGFVDFPVGLKYVGTCVPADVMNDSIALLDLLGPRVGELLALLGTGGTE